MSAPSGEDTTPHSWWCVVSTWVPLAAVASAGYDVAGRAGAVPYPGLLERYYLLSALSALLVVTAAFDRSGCARALCVGWGWLGRGLYALTDWASRGLAAAVGAYALFLGYAVAVTVAPAAAGVAITDVGFAVAAVLVGLPGYSRRKRRAEQARRWWS